MSNLVEVTVKSSTETNKGNFCNKLTVPGAVVDTPLGPVEGNGRTFYLFTNKQNEVGFKTKLDISLFDKVTKQYAVKDETGAPVLDDDKQPMVATLNYLYPKRG